MCIFTKKPLQYTSYRIPAKLFLNRVLRHFKWTNTNYRYRKIVANCCGIMISLIRFDDKRTKKLNKRGLNYNVSLYRKLFSADDATVVPLDHFNLSAVANYALHKAKLVLVAFMARYDLTKHDLSRKALNNLKLVEKLAWQQGLRD